MFDRLKPELARCKKSTSRASFSIARTSPAFSKSNSVSGPSPGPISRTLSAFVNSAASTMRRKLIAVVQKILAEGFRDCFARTSRISVH